jgi:uncharacterized SAM-binding protein YcdF (DUF218 family)
MPLPIPALQPPVHWKLEEFPALTRRPLSPRRRIPRKKARRKLPDWKLRLAVAAATAVVALLAWAAIARGLAPVSNTSLTRFDAIIVLGTPADSDGNPTPEQLARVTEGVNEYKRGTAPRLILSGGAAHNRFVEARVMARTAEAQGIPTSAILVEPQAMDTIQNACYSVRIMEAHGWRSAEVVSTAYHLPTAALIFNALPLQWAVHPAPPLSPTSSAYDTALAAVEVLKTARYLIWARWAEHCEP